MHRYTPGRDWLQLLVSLCGNSLPIHPATPYSSCRGDSLPPRAFSAASSLVTMATAAWPWVWCCSYDKLDLNSSPHPGRAGTHDSGNWPASGCWWSRSFGCQWKRQGSSQHSCDWTLETLDCWLRWKVELFKQKCPKSSGFSMWGFPACLMW